MHRPFSQVHEVPYMTDTINKRSFFTFSFCLLCDLTVLVLPVSGVLGGTHSGWRCRWLVVRIHL